MNGRMMYGLSPGRSVENLLGGAHLRIGVLAYGFDTQKLWEHVERSLGWYCIGVGTHGFSQVLSCPEYF